jgi:hypothetical protein
MRTYIVARVYEDGHGFTRFVTTDRPDKTGQAFNTALVAEKKNTECRI